MDIMICPKTRELVDHDSCLALKKMSKPLAESFARKICLNANDCPNEVCCSIFEAGWTGFKEFVQTLEVNKI